MINPMNFHGTLMQLQLVRLLWDRLNGGSKAKNSRVMYGAPVWADDLMASHRSILLLRRLHRATAIRIVRGYRTVSHASATVLVASPPWKLRALVLKRRYIHMRLWDPGEDSTEQAAPKDLGTAEDNA
ncbi:uncharacterized protein LOC122575574 isoform X5 [Bombus pyrosoma]|uniref:uncharacterized protein LOC122575574 isoform X5 n=1 Tax=Bombus pyrosoma TaxID=396416 RepID=UPI001CB9AD42|nr:uncharacterized protein LOC122575574 isoform X5 [Bombus pyrosoma]